MHPDDFLTTSRRGFMGRLAAAAAFLGLGSAPTTLMAARTRSTATTANPDFEAWLNGINGKHKQVFDAVSPNEGLPAAYTRVWRGSRRVAMRDHHPFRTDRHHRRGHSTQHGVGSATLVGNAGFHLHLPALDEAHDN